MFLKKLCLITSLSVLPFSHLQADETKPPEDPVPNVTNNKPACVCLLHKLTDDLVKNCTQENSTEDSKFLLRCSNFSGKKQPIKNPKAWRVLSAEDEDCKPCTQTERPPSGIITRG